MSRNRATIGIVAISAAALSGCADYLNRYDTVTLAAGDANRHNLMLHRVDNLNPASNDTTITTDGGRAADAVKKYQNSQKPGAAPAPNITVNVGAPK
jgi:hypothetical protein